MAAGVSSAETVWKRSVSVPSGSVWVIEFSTVFQRPAVGVLRLREPENVALRRDSATWLSRSATFPEFDQGFDDRRDTAADRG
jgi:hypothetical protein